MKDTLAAITEARAGFMDLVAEVRPELHRYCARMTGSVIDGEDVVQDTLAKAYFALAQMREIPGLRPWLFRIAHNTCMDFIRRYERKNVDLVAEVPEAEQDVPLDGARVEQAISAFALLPPQQRSAFVLKEVLGHSLEETAETMGTSVGAVKAALSRARGNVARRAPEASMDLALLRRYVDLFNARDWDALRAMLVEESRLDLVTRAEQRGPEIQYFDRYEVIADREGLRAVPGKIDGQPGIGMYRGSEATPSYFVLLTGSRYRLELIRDFHYVPYIAIEATFEPV